MSTTAKETLVDFDKALLDIDYLVYSSHKSATQTVSHTLRMNGYKCIHCHSLTNETTNLKLGTFALFLECYHAENNKKLYIISTFREPIERRISSFLQWHGEGVVRKKIIRDTADTIIHKMPLNELQEVFVEQIARQIKVGQMESINEMCNELNLRIPNLHYSLDEQYGLNELDHCRLFLFRFDAMIYENKLEYLFSNLVGRPIIKHDANLSSAKWYRDKFAAFKASLHIPGDLILSIYDAQRELINLFYPDQYNSMLSQALQKYTQGV